MMKCLQSPSLSISLIKPYGDGDSYYLLTPSDDVFVVSESVVSGRCQVYFLNIPWSDQMPFDAIYVGKIS